MTLLPLHLRYERSPPQSAVVEHGLPPPARVVVVASVVVVGAAVVVVGLAVVVVGFKVVVEGRNVVAVVCVVVVSCRVVDVDGASAVEFAGGFSWSMFVGEQMQPQMRRTETVTSGIVFIG
jgi:hypothetical protein